MKVTFIMPGVGRKTDTPYVKTWQMEPLSIAVLSALTPAPVEKIFYDDRIEDIPYGEPTDLVAISVETYTAQRAYQISQRYRSKGVPVVLGGFHVTLQPEEAQLHADAIVIGEAEQTWPSVLEDFQDGRLKKVYRSDSEPDLKGFFPDRAIYAHKKYMNIALVETGRGCRYSCEFCSVTSFFSHTYHARPVEDVIEELKKLDRNKIIFFIDDNIAVDFERTKQLFTALKPLGLKWVGQVSITIVKKEPLVALMKESGCLGVLIGFESLDMHNLNLMGKRINVSMDVYEYALKIFKKHSLILYVTFLFGYDHDTEITFAQTYSFAQKNKFFFTAFNHLVPFPGTPLYTRMQSEGRLLYKKWWLEKEYRFGDVAFKPVTMSPEALTDLCLYYRKKMYSLPSIVKRGMDFKNNCRTMVLFITYFFLNIQSGFDVSRRQGLPLGVREE